MKFKIVLSLNGLEETLQVISETFKNWMVWKVQFKNGVEAILFKFMDTWMQRNEDNLDHQIVAAIGKQIDNFNLKISFAQMVY
jgi:hypothetical protein